MKTLELHYPMIQFLINDVIPRHRKYSQSDTGKPLYIRWYFIQLSFHAPRVCPIVLVTVFPMACYILDVTRWREYITFTFEWQERVSAADE